MNTYPHQQFIKDNNISVESLPIDLRKRIKGFDELLEDLEHTLDSDRENLEDRLETLTHELAEDLEEHFEDYLQNNDQEEEITEEVKIEETEEEYTEEKEESEFEPPAEPQPQESKEPDNEEILALLYAEKKYRVTPTELRTRGFKGRLEDRRMKFGKYILCKKKYHSSYSIHKTS